MASKATTKTTSGNTTLVSSKKKIKTDIPLLNTPDDIDASKFDVSADQVTADQVDYTDPNFDFKNLTADKLADRFMTAADYTLLDPADVESQFGDITRSETEKNSALSSKLALDSLDTELKGLQNYAPAAATLQRQQTALDNTANQATKTQMLDQADPSIRTDLSDQAARLKSYAEGKVPDSITDRQLELGIQSSAADSAATSGFGAGSSAAAKAGQLMSAQQRIALSQYGDQALSGNIAQRTSTEVATQENDDAGSKIQIMPSQSAGQTSLAIASQLNSGNIDAKTALASDVQQQQFKSSLQQDTNKTNLQTESDRDLNQAKLNLEADTTNADNSIRTQIAAKQIQSSEKTFNAELKTNTATANADRSFQASNANAGRALETATSNRAVKLDVEKTNKTMVFQDQQRVKSENFSASQSAAAEAGANARAAMSASSQAASLAASQDEADKDRAFQLEQQQKALDIYNQNRDTAQNSATWSSVGTLISRAPSIVTGVSNAINTVSGWLGGGGGGTAENPGSAITHLFGG